MTDWKAIAYTYAQAYAEMREAFYIADHNNGDTSSAQHVRAAAKLIADIPTAVIVELMEPTPPAAQFDPNANYVRKETAPGRWNWVRREDKP